MIKYKLSRLHHIFILILLLLCCSVKQSYADYALNMPYGVSPMSHQIYDLHMAVFYICCVIGLVVFAAIFYSLIKFRKSKGAEASHFHEHLTIEIIWTTIPFLILVALAIPATIVLGNIHDTEESALTIKVTGYQWKWRYEYLNKDVSFFSFLATPLDQVYSKAPKNPWYLLEVDTPMVVPINTKVKLLITADDVIHSWWVPELGVKQDAVPGFINENWIYVDKPGEYRGQCGELCGINHAFMPIVVKAVSQAEFDQWILSQHQLKLTLDQQANVSTMPQDKLLALGKVEYEKNCAMCHQNNGEGLYSTFPPLKASRVVTSPLNENIVYVLRGVPGTPMQAFGKILDDTTLAAIITYTRTAWGNDTINQHRQFPTVAQPKDIKEVRKIVKIEY